MFSSWTESDAAPDMQEPQTAEASEVEIIPVEDESNQSRRPRTPKGSSGGRHSYLQWLHSSRDLCGSEDAGRALRDEILANARKFGVVIPFDGKPITTRSFWERRHVPYAVGVSISMAVCVGGAFFTATGNLAALLGFLIIMFGYLGKVYHLHDWNTVSGVWKADAFCSVYLKLDEESARRVRAQTVRAATLVCFNLGDLTPATLNRCLAMLLMSSVFVAHVILLDAAERRRRWGELCLIGALNVAGGFLLDRANDSGIPTTFSVFIPHAYAVKAQAAELIAKLRREMNRETKRRRRSHGLSHSPLGSTASETKEGSAGTGSTELGRVERVDSVDMGADEWLASIKVSLAELQYDVGMLSEVWAFYFINVEWFFVLFVACAVVGGCQLLQRATAPGRAALMPFAVVLLLWAGLGFSTVCQVFLAGAGVTAECDRVISTLQTAALHMPDDTAPEVIAELDRLRAAVAEGGRLAFRPFGFRISHAAAAAVANVVAAFILSMLLEQYSFTSA